MESQPNESAPELKKNPPTSHPHSKACFAAYSAIGLLLLTWLCFLFSLGILWKKNLDRRTQNEAQVIQIQNQLLQNQANEKNLQKQILQIQDFIQQRFLPDDNEVLLAQANQLVHLAYYSLTYLYDNSSALTALKLAEESLVKIKSPDTQLHQLHDQVLNGITALKALPTTDLAATLTKLSHIQAQIPQLSLLGIQMTHPYTDPSKTPMPHVKKKWYKPVQDSFTKLQQLIVIRHFDKPVQPLLPAIEQRYIQIRLQFLLQQAQWALLHNQPRIYQSSLEQTQETIQHYFAVDTSIGQTVIQTILELKKIDLLVALPDLASTLQLLASIKEAQPASTLQQKESLE